MIVKVGTSWTRRIVPSQKARDHHQLAFNVVDPCSCRCRCMGQAQTQRPMTHSLVWDYAYAHGATQYTRAE